MWKSFNLSWSLSSLCSAHCHHDQALMVFSASLFPHLLSSHSSISSCQFHLWLSVGFEFSYLHLLRHFDQILFWSIFLFCFQSTQSSLGLIIMFSFHETYHWFIFLPFCSIVLYCLCFKYFLNYAKLGPFPRCIKGVENVHMKSGREWKGGSKKLWNFDSIEGHRWTCHLKHFQKVTKCHWSNII